MHTDFPKTRYQGSKKRILEWIKESTSSLEFNTVLDVFGGTGSVSYLMKSMGKEVTFNDNLISNVCSARALLKNNATTLKPEWIDKVFELPPTSGIISKKYENIFFTKEENLQIDTIMNGILRGDDTTRLTGFRKDLALHSLFQSLLMKRPFNLFHRANLNIRLKECERTFGNKITWEKPLKDLMVKNLKEANNAVFNNGKIHKVSCKDALKINEKYDLVYLDPPYYNASGLSADYQNYYSFLDGLCTYDTWEDNIDFEKKNLPLIKKDFSFKNLKFNSDLRTLLKKHNESIIVMSYKSPGLPSCEDIEKIIGESHEKPIIHSRSFNYALNRNNKDCSEMLFISLPKK